MQIRQGPAALAAAALLLAGCTPLQWVKADASPQEVNRDAVLCQQAAWREARWRAWYYRPLGPLVLHDATGRRFFAWPHGPFADPFGDPFLEESRLAQFCMRAKGYELQPVEKPAETIQPSPEKASGGKP